MHYGIGTFGSRGIAIGGTALHLALEDVVAKAKKYAAHLMQADESSVSFVDGIFSAGDKSVTIQDIALDAHLGRNLPPDTEPGLSATRLYEPANFAFPFGAHICMVELDKDTAERWIEQPIRMDPPEVEAPAAAETPKPWIKEIPQAPIRGKLSCYAIEEAVFDVVSASCRRIGLEIARRPAAEVPNPSVHKDEIVAVEVPIGDDRRFEWCKRLKSNQPTARVVMLMQHPSRPRVLQGLLAKADVIVGLPVEEPQLSEKLAGLLEPAPDSPHK